MFSHRRLNLNEQRRWQVVSLYLCAFSLTMLALLLGLNLSLLAHAFGQSDPLHVMPILKLSAGVLCVGIGLGGYLTHRGIQRLSRLVQTPSTPSN